MLYTTNQDQGASSSPWWNRRKNRRKEHGQEEADPTGHGCQACLSSFGNTGAALDKGRHGRTAKKCAHGDAESVCTIGERRPGEVSSVWIYDARKARHRVECSRAVDNVHVEKGEESECEVARFASYVPIQHVQGPVNMVELGYLFEKAETIVADLGSWKVRHWRVSSTRTLVYWAVQGGLSHTYGHEMMDTRRIANIMALLTLYDIKYAVKMPPAMIPSHIYVR